MSPQRRIVITGASRGLGRAMTESFLALGHQVFGCARSSAAVERLNRAVGPARKFAAVDVADDQAVSRWARDVLAAGGPPDLLLNNAALVNHTAPLWEIPPDQFSDVIDVNIKGVYHVIRHFVPAMIAAGRGVIALVVLSAVPIIGPDSPLSIGVMERTRRIARTLCHDERVLLHGQANPNVGSLDQQLAAMDELVADHPITAWKVYTHAPAPGWYLDDHDPAAARVGEAFLRKAAETRPIVCVHKGLSAGSPYASPVDIGPAAKAHPDITFVVYHSGYERGTTEGPYEPATRDQGVNRLVATLEDAGIGPGGNVYAELGSTWRTVMGDPTEAAHVLGKLLVALGPERILWGTDSIWYGSPQDQIQAFRAFRISAEYQERYGYPELTDEVKARILGLNAAELYGVEPDAVACPFTREELQAARAAEPASFRTYGPTTPAQVRVLIDQHGGIAR